MALNPLFQLLNKITSLGINKKQNRYVKIKMRVLNSVAIFTIFISPLYAYLHYCNHDHIIAIASNIFITITALFIVLFHYLYKHKLADVVAATGYTLGFVGSSIGASLGSQFEYFLILTGLASIFLFKKWTYKWLFFSFNFIAFVCLKIYYLHHFEYDSLSPLFGLLNGIVAFILVYTIVYYATNQNNELTNQLLQLNNTLENKVIKRTKEIDLKSKALERSNEELKRFSYVSAHDLREPLCNILGIVEVLNENIIKQQHEDLLAYVKLIKMSVSRMDVVTKDIVNYTGLEDKFEVCSYVDSQLLVEQIVSNTHWVANRVDVLVLGLPKLLINKRLCEILFQQLIDNAIQYCDKEKVEIEVGYFQKEGIGEFFVKDNGRGIAKEHQEKIFMMFKRIHTNINQSASGVGLAICERIVTGYGGKIWIESELGVSSTFYFTLPTANLTIKPSLLTHAENNI